MATILIIDAERSEREALAEQIEEWGYGLLTARSAEEARDHLEKAGIGIDTVLLDWRLPDGEGLDLLRWIKNQPFGEELEVIIQAGSVVPGEIRRGIRQGAFYFLTKPYTDPQLHALLQGAVSSRELRRTVRTAARKLQDCFRLLNEGTFLVRTIEDAELLAAHIGAASGDPQRGVGVLELLINGIEHGNLGISYEEKSSFLAAGTYEVELERRLESAEYADRYVRVELRRDNGQLRLLIADQGPGFDYRRYQSFDKERFFDAHGRGVLLASAALDLEFLDPGNQVWVTVPLAA